ncbi:MAG: alcohol dehydrogenase [Anaerotignum sp.]
MKAVVYKGHGKVCLEDRPMPTIIEDTDVIVRVTRSTICSSDLHIKHGSVPRAKENIVLGHEFVGEIVEAGKEVSRFQVGDCVAVNVETFCGKCFFCKQGYVNNCIKGGWELGCRIDGGQAEYARIPMADQGLTKIPEGVLDEEVLFNGDILATGYWAARIGEIKPADTVVVLGAGPTGLCTLMSIQLYGPAKVIIVDINNDRMALAKQQGLADICLNPLEVNIEEEILKLTQGRGADRVFEVAGAKDTFELAWKIARPNAIVVLVALYAKEQTLPLHQMYGKNLTFKTGGVDANCCDDIMKMVQYKKIDTSCLITHRSPLNDVMEGYHVFENMLDGCIKWVITPYETK